ncbi:MAG: orotidine-5'-phosphate decarboxylase [Thermodesulfobacteriota bacterium]|nr:MAG: orotidine-5'-phosphate decarboxylase [Thermodesulfobacteriota bacterium]
MSLSPKDRIIFALDVPDIKGAQRYVDLLKDRVGVFKVGLELFVACGPDVVRMVRERGGRAVFLDLKFHDIPETVKGAVRSAAALGVDFITVHASDGSSLLKAAVEAAGKTKVLGVTVLTSLSKDSFSEAGIDGDFTPESLVLYRAGVAKASRCAGIVSSGLEAGAVREALGPDFLIVTPGVRMAEDARGDQKRIVTPFEAVSNGADYIVVGRPIRDSKDPAGAAERIASEIEKAMQGRAL